MVNAVFGDSLFRNDHLTLFVLFVQALNFRMCGVFLVDSSFMVEGSKFISGTMAALSVMVNISIPHVNVLTKMDLLNAESRNQLER